MVNFSSRRPVAAAARASLAAALTLALASPAAALVVDFETFPPGTILTSQDGFTVTVVNDKAGHPNSAIVFDSACPNDECSGDDFDLRTPGQGVGNDTAQNHVLVIAENVRDESPDDGLVDNPDDERNGGSITIGFPSALSVESVRVIDIDTNETTGFIELTLDGGGTTSQPLLALGNNSAQTVVFPGAPLATAMKVFFTGSGAIDDIVLNEGTTTSSTTSTTTGGQTTTTVPATTTTVPATTTTVPVTTTTTGGATTTTIPVTTTSLGGATTTTVPGPFCGDGIVQPGEVCEPSLTVGCGPDCRLAACPLQTEICNNAIDDDGDGLADCLDPDCPRGGVPPCFCPAIRRDPAIIMFDTKKGKGADFFSIHGNFLIHSPVDFESEPFSVALANANGPIWRGTLVAGEIKRKAGGKGRFVFRDRFALDGGPGDADNFYRVGMRVRKHKDGEKAVHFRVRAYGDFSAATDPMMTLHLSIGDDNAGTTQAWKRKKWGWILHQRDFSE